MKEPPRGVAAVERALRLLGCFDAAGETLTLAQLAQRSRLYKSTILRLATSLQKGGFLHRDASGRFALGSELRRLGELARVAEELESIVRPVMKALTDDTEETVSFYVRQGRHRVCLFREASPGSVRHSLVEGGRHTLIVGATGRIFKAYGTGASDAADVQIRRRGWVASRGERKPNLGAVAVPLLTQARTLGRAECDDVVASLHEAQRATGARPFDRQPQASSTAAGANGCQSDRAFAATDAHCMIGIGTTRTEPKAAACFQEALACRLPFCGRRIGRSGD